MKPRSFVVAALGLVAIAGCSDAASPPATQPSAIQDEFIRHRSDIIPVTRVEDAKSRVFIPPFLDCRVPAAGDTAASADGKVCTQVSIAGATEPGKSFASYASCDVVRTQRPYYPRPAAHAPKADDPRLNDTHFMAELAWAKTQIAATGCACCHDATIAPRGASQWDLSAGPIWLDTISDTGLALFAGLADSSVLGTFPASANHGFDRTATGVPSTDTARMRAFVEAELASRGVSQATSRAVPPFGGPIYEQSVRSPTICAGEGVDKSGRVVFLGDEARYVYVLEVGSKNPGVPPNLDRPMGTVWRLDVLPSAEAVKSGITYGRTPAGTFQDTPDVGRAPDLVTGRTYQLTVLRDVGIPTTNCTFVAGEPLAPGPKSDPTSPPPGDGGGPIVDSGSGGDAFGASCTAGSTTCTGASSYCAVMPGSSTGYCTATGCTENSSVCPPSWGCFDLSVFQAGAPSICTKP